MASSLLADLTRAVAFQGVALNTTTITNGVITGCQVDLLDLSKVEVRQFREPLALAQGLDVGGVWFGGRHVTLQGTVYGSSRADADSRIGTLEAAFDPTAIYGATPGSFGYAALTWYSIGGGAQRTLYCLPEGLQVASRRGLFGGPDGAPLAIPWTVQLLAKNPVVA